MVLRLAGGALVGGGVARPDPDNGAGAGPKLARFASSVRAAFVRGYKPAPPILALREGSGP
jgi:hypothetical protein